MNKRWFRNGIRYEYVNNYEYIMNNYINEIIYLSVNNFWVIINNINILYKIIKNNYYFFKLK